MEPIRVTVHPFVRSDGEDRTKHTTTLAAALEEMIEDDHAREFERYLRQPKLATAHLKKALECRR